MAHYAINKAIACSVAVVMLGAIALPVSALTISSAKIDKGAVQVKGTKAEPLALIFWEGQVVAQATNRGGFRFATSILPEDCVGELSDGAQTKAIVIGQCGQVGPRGPQGPPGDQGPQGNQGPPGQDCGYCGEPTPTATQTPGFEDAHTVTFTLTVTEPIEGFKISVTYPLGKGSFIGSANEVACTTSGDGIFAPNDNDSGTLQLVAAKVPGTLTFPQTITCAFDATTALDASDLTATVAETTQNGGQAGNSNALAVVVAVAAPS